MHMNFFSKAGCGFITIALLTHLNTMHAQTNTDVEASVVDIEGKMALEFSNEKLLGTNVNTALLEPSLELDFQYKPSYRLKLGANLEFSRVLEESTSASGEEHTDSLSVNEAYVKLSDIPLKHRYLEGLSLIVGRKNISDSREWFYDAEIDGLIVEVEAPTYNTSMTFSFNREEWIGSDLLQDNDKGTVDNIIVEIEYQPWKNLELSAHYIARNDTSENNDSPRHLGFSVKGKSLDKRLAFWSDMAMVDGVDGDERIDGTGYDIGATFKMSSIGKPYITLNYAVGSGNGDDDTDFRQTGLHDNVDKLGGVTSFKYYGEVVDPELSNLKILTAGIGFRPRKKVSIDVLYHNYEQEFALDELRDSDLSTDPNGLATDIGYAWDLVAGFENRENVETEFVLGYFKPGEAFDDRTDVLLFNAKLTYLF